MIRRFIAMSAVAAAMVFGTVAEASAFYSPSQRAAIRSMPITQRPYRPGHVYGNTVRLLNRVMR